MQQFKAKLKNVPTDASQVCSSTNPLLNRDKSLSAVNDSLRNELTLNNPEVNQVPQTERSLKSFVFVLSREGEPLMPCSYAKSKRMVKKGAAKVIKRFPLTVQLNFDCKNKTQEVNLGVDTGFGNIGFSATSEKKELISGVLILDGKTKERLDEKRMYRRGKRSRHHWYREPRFDNRKRKEGWLPPSIERRYQTHLILIERLKKILPISKIIVEIAKFDIQKIENPEIEGNGYQQGSLYEYQNVKNYLMAREKGKCQFCLKDFKGQKSQVHHIKPRSAGGNNRPNNLAILHEKCHNQLHTKQLEKTLKSTSKSYKQSIFMSIISNRFWKDIPKLEVTYGNITFVDRNELGLDKTHSNDAFVISKGTNQERCKTVEIKQVHRNNRVLQINRNGFRPSIKKEKSKINPGDVFWINAKRYICKGMFNTGKYITYGSTKKKEYFKFSEVTKIFHFGSFVWGI